MKDIPVIKLTNQGYTDESIRDIGPWIPETNNNLLTSPNYLSSIVRGQYILYPSQQLRHNNHIFCDEILVQHNIQLHRQVHDRVLHF